MAQCVSTSITRRGVVAGLAVVAVPVALASADSASQAKPEKSLYERLVASSRLRRSWITSATPS
jgi:hypothetical protein